MKKLSLKAEKRKVFGRKVKNLRKQDLLPGNIFGREFKSLAVQAELKEFEKIFKEAGETRIIEIQVDKKKAPVLISNIQKDPVTDDYVHVDFMKVDLKKKVTAKIPVELVGESPAEKKGVGVVVSQLDEIEVESLPTDLPEKFEIDISKLEQVDQAIYIKDIKIEKDKIEIKENEDKIIVKIEPPSKEEEPIAVKEEVEGEAEDVEEGEGDLKEKEEGQEEGKKKEESDKETKEVKEEK